MTVEVTWERILYMTIYHPLLFMFIWAYWQTVFTEPAYPRSEYYLSRDEVHKVENAVTDEDRAQTLKHAARNIQAQNRTYGGAHRYCHINKCIKPDRSHYCSGKVCDLLFCLKTFISGEKGCTKNGSLLPLGE